MNQPDVGQVKAVLETLVHTLPIGVVVLDAGTGRIQYVNIELTRIVDTLREEGEQSNDFLQEIVCVRSNGTELALKDFSVAELISAGETVRAEEITLKAPGEKSITVLINATPVRLDDGSFTSFVVTLQDMTPMQDQERLRLEFLAMVSHELRTPLTSIKGSASLYLNAKDYVEPQLIARYFRIIDDQAERMSSLVTDLLDSARIETGNLAVKPVPSDVAVLVDSARVLFTSAGGSNHLHLDVDPNLPLVMADGERIVQVLKNLLQNASRCSPEKATIKVSTELQGIDVAFSVTDTGHGIPADRMDQLFRKFSRQHQEEHGGDTGLGLAICKGIVEAHGGRIWAESEGPGMGARFTFTLPTVDDNWISSTEPEPTPAERARRGQRGIGERVRVLAVDDDPEILRYLRDALHATGYHPIVTGSPEEAIRMVEEERPHLVVLDLMLPGIDGIDLMEDIFELADVPVIFLSAYGREEMVTKAFEMGAMDYVVKPFSPTELAARIKSALRRRIAPEPSEPYAMGDLFIDFAERNVTLAGRRIELVAMEYKVLAELSASAGRVLTFQQLLERVWGDKNSGDVRPLRTIISKLRNRLRDDADNPTYIFTEPRVGYRMPRGRPRPEEPSASD